MGVARGHGDGFRVAVGSAWRGDSGSGGRARCGGAITPGLLVAKRSASAATSWLRWSSSSRQACRSTRRGGPEQRAHACCSASIPVVRDSAQLPPSARVLRVLTTGAPAAPRVCGPGASGRGVHTREYADGAAMHNYARRPLSAARGPPRLTVLAKTDSPATSSPATRRSSISSKSRRHSGSTFNHSTAPRRSAAAPSACA
jgi:hypothetical protein